MPPRSPHPTDPVPRKTIRVPEDLWQTAQRTARARGHTVSEVLRSALRAYVRQSMPRPEVHSPPAATAAPSLTEPPTSTAPADGHAGAAGTVGDDAQINAG